MSDTFNYVKKGYDPTEVDQYIAKLEDVLKSYKEKDSAIKNAILNAQIAADNIVRNAELRAEDLTSDAIRRVNAISDSVEKQKEFLSQFEDDYKHMVKKYLTDFETGQMSPLYRSLDELKSYLQSLTAPPAGENPAPIDNP